MSCTSYTIAVVTLLTLNILVYSIIFIEGSRPPLTIHYLAVGQADATFIETATGNRMLIDVGGGRSTADTVAGLLPFYDQRIDVVLVTHPHSDHMDGLVALLEYVDVGLVLDSGSGHTTGVVKDYLIALEENNVDKIYARRGMIVNLSREVKVYILFPDRNTRALDPDNASVWAKVKHGGNSFLFTGDAFVAIEEYMVDMDGERLRSDVFQAGHHGSRTSNSFDLLNSVMPEYVVVSAGVNNRYGHPHSEALEAFEYVGAEVLETPNDGNIVFISNEHGIERIK